LTLGKVAIKDFSNSRVLERLLMYERRIENSMLKTMDELRRRRLMRELEQAREELFSPGHRPGLTVAGAATAPVAQAKQPGFAQLRRGKKNAKQSQFFSPGHCPGLTVAMGSHG